MSLLVRPALAAILFAGGTLAERLPFRPFTTTQGLPSNSINRIVRDSRGFLWFCTGDGLSRFDGYDFVNFASAPDFAGRAVWDLIETRAGEYWAATGDGLARLSGSGRRLLGGVQADTDPKSRVVLALKEGPDGTLWAGTEAGLYRLHRNPPRLTRVDTGPLPEPWSEPAITALEYDGEGNLWFGSFAGIGRIQKDGRVERWTPRQGFASYVVSALYRDVDGTMWAGTEEGLCHMLPKLRCFARNDGLPSPYVQAIVRTRAGCLWAGTLEGAAYACSEPLVFTPVTTRHGLSDTDVSALVEDASGSLWLGTGADGAMSLSQENAVMFTEADGLAASNVVAVLEDRENHLYAVTRSLTDLVLHRLDGMRFIPIRPRYPAAVRAFGRGYQQVALQDRSGQWWIATGDGLLRYRSSDLRGFADIYTRPASPDRPNVFRLYEDSRGNVWWSASSRISNVLACWHRAGGAIEYFGHDDGLPPLVSNLPTAFVEDDAGALWLGFESAGVARRRSDGRFEYLGREQGGPDSRIRASYRDRAGRLWFASSTGLWRLDQPAAVRPRFVRYGSAEGLSNPTVHSLTGDLQGRIYAATSLALDRLDPRTGQIEHFTAADGLPAGIIQAAYCDRSGVLWLATRHGIARLIPRASGRRQGFAKTVVTGIRVRGMERPISVAGESEAHLLLRPDENQVEFAFVTPRSSSPDSLYQYHLEGVEASEWSSPSQLRSVNFASLAPGSYRFVVRSIDAQGIPTSAPASVAFRILPPLWATWWFRLAAAVLVCAAAYSLYHYRMRAAIEREHLRIRLATDLHDDIGASLSSIAIWSDLAVQQARTSDSALLRPLEQIGAVSREVIDSVSDMVWAINPNHDRFDELSSRMRRYVGELAVSANRPISFTVAGAERQAAVGPAVRRELFLVFKEALNNALRHSGFTNCAVSLVIDSGWITLRVSDNGKGFDPDTRAAGTGLDSMRRRALRLAGSVRIESKPGEGTIVELRLPAAARAHIFRWRRQPHVSATLKSRDQRRHH